mmetsp:Transcript_21562/g.54871  ORF Transcript_21562/g.54871 Transcript_21562/m.54871 type:complete len:269 (-) Transcript_21562:1787-2593(-)
MTLGATCHSQIRICLAGPRAARRHPKAQLKPQGDEESESEPASWLLWSGLLMGSLNTAPAMAASLLRAPACMGCTTALAALAAVPATLVAASATASTPELTADATAAAAREGLGVGGANQRLAGLRSGLGFCCSPGAGKNLNTTTPLDSILYSATPSQCAGGGGEGVGSGAGLTVTTGAGRGEGERAAGGAAAAGITATAGEDARTGTGEAARAGAGAAVASAVGVAAGRWSSSSQDAGTATSVTGGFLSVASAISMSSRRACRSCAS